METSKKFILNEMDDGCVGQSNMKIPQGNDQGSRVAIVFQYPGHDNKSKFEFNFI